LKLSKILRVYVLAIGFLLYLPIFLVVVNSFNVNPFIGEWRGFTLKWYALLLRDFEAMQGLTNSLTIAIASASLSVFLALLASMFMIEHGEFRVMDAFVYPPIVMPEVVEAVALMMAFQYAGASFGWLTVMIGHTAFNVAFAYIILNSTRVRFPELEGAARTLGASSLQAFLRISLPLAVPGISVALAITFLLSFTNFIKTLYTTGPGFYTLPLLVWNRARRPGIAEYTYPNALNALATILLALSFIIALVFTLFTLKRERK